MMDEIDALRFEKTRNTSGIAPLDLRVLVKPDSAERRTPGGIILPDETVEKDEWAMQKGTLVAVGTCAWAEAKADRGFEAPEPGDRVLIGKYSGTKVTGTDGEKYLMMNDADVLGVLTEA
jgi:chaperonin GroES